MSNETDPEIFAMSTILTTLKGLDAASQTRVIQYVLNRLNLRGSFEPPIPARDPSANSSEVADSPPGGSVDEAADKSNADPDGISGLAQKWIRRSGLDSNGLSELFSIGTDEIDLIAKGVPGKSVRARMHNVLLLKGVAAYLSSGTPRFSHEQAKEVCGHYKAFDGPNFSKHLKSFSSEMNGGKESGYTLTARGLACAAEIIKEISASQLKA